MMNRKGKTTVMRRNWQKGANGSWGVLGPPPWISKLIYAAHELSNTPDYKMFPPALVQN